MKKILKAARVLLIVLSLSIMSLATMPRSAMATSKCGETVTFFDWNCDSEGSIMSVLGTILNWVAAGVVVVVLIGILYGAVMYASAGGKEDQVKKAIGIIRNAIIALILYFAMYALLQYLIPGGLFS